MGTERERRDRPAGASPAATPLPANPSAAALQAGPATVLQAICAALATAAALLVAAAWVLLSFVLAGAAGNPLPPPYPGLFAAVAAAALVAAPLAERRLLADAAGDRRRAYVRAKVVGFALRELVAVNGFLLALATGRIAWSFALSTAALIAMALAWPRAADLAAAPPGGDG